MYIMPVYLQVWINCRFVLPRMVENWILTADPFTGANKLKKRQFMRTYSFFALFHKAFYGFRLRTVNKLLSFLTTACEALYALPSTYITGNWSSFLFTGKRENQILFSNKQFVNEIYILSYYIGGEYHSVYSIGALWLRIAKLCLL